MPATAITSVLLLSSLLALTTGTQASSPGDSVQVADSDLYPAVPSDLDTNQWAPYTTLEPVASTPSISTPTATASADDSVRILPALDANAIPEIKERQVTGQGTAAAATAIKQVSPITTYYIASEISGSQVQVPVVYTQTFPVSYVQWASPTAGEIGLGTIQGTIGVVRTDRKRSLPTQAPLGELPALESASEPPAAETTQSLDDQREEQQGHQKSDDGHAYSSKLSKVGSSIQHELAEWLKFAKQQKDKAEKEVKKPCAKCGMDTDEDAVSNDAHILKAGTVAALAVGVATLGLAYL
ncbi:hypothetical protein HRR83_006912 [Exophiala dermatitidis]|uniref:Uncharacterized protein n=1 Tax=Exophiala dermatitidis TaxID=5970 RepID=A0AAN6ES10_EXODE|nr:hypothetical protein HRR75_005892 [Exophiala dermatitidis]KAJ4512396.1 hypothetical protein HRR73_005951 [Exophiala dermatitidis]KAJ4512730.1 hypothetical protein HRR74_006428 [Exophiala dermatitidis]KAJ4542534.1 hypothetical protein HRR77_005732 [Exophiala dermatitidis]KAJ4546541.1 hypothetical protein HRR78_005542 [Exophiala dermatitidis]